MAQAGATAAAESAGGETVTLFGSLGSPITANQFSINPDEAQVHWMFGCTTSAFNSIDRGKAQRATYDTGVLATFISVSGWVDPTDFQDGPYYIRAQLKSGDDQPVAGDGLPLEVIGTADDAGDWFTLTNDSTNRGWRWHATGPVGMKVATIKVEISTGASEAGILATGYYKANAHNEF